MKALILVLVALVTSTQALAQKFENTSRAKGSGSRRTFSQLTPQLSVTGSVLEGDDTQELDGQNTGMGAGVLIDIGRRDFLFETGILYRQMGGVAYLYSEDEARQKGLTTRLESEIELNYLVLPLMGKYYFNGRANPSFIARAGLQPAFLIYREARPKNSSSTELRDLKSANDFDLTAAVGAGFQIPINSTSMFVFEGTYLRGLTTVLSNSNVYHHGFSANFGLGILL